VAVMPSWPGSSPRRQRVCNPPPPVLRNLRAPPTPCSVRYRTQAAQAAFSWS